MGPGRSGCHLSIPIAKAAGTEFQLPAGHGVKPHGTVQSKGSDPHVNRQR